MPPSFKLEIRELRDKLKTSMEQADLAVEAGPKAIADALERGDKAAVKSNKKTLADAKKARRNLANAIQSLQDSCCDQVFGCDPTYS